MIEKHQTVADYAFNLHAQRGQLYGDQPYSVHLLQAYEILLPLFGDNDTVMLSILCHDLLEDTGITYNDLAKVTGYFVADVVYDVTNELGKNRRERAERTYPKIAANPLAIIVKVADRLANTRHSRQSGSSMYQKYRAEYRHFKDALFTGVNQESWRVYPKIYDLWALLDAENA